MLKRTFSVTALVVALMFVWTTGAFADSGSTTVTATVPTSLSITVPASQALSVTIGSQTTNPLAITVKTNTAWSMTVYKDGDLTGATDSIGSSRLVYAASSTNGTANGSNTQFATSGSPSNVVTGGTQTGEAGASTTVNYKLTANYDDNPETYTAVHTYTAAAI